MGHKKINRQPLRQNELRDILGQTIVLVMPKIKQFRSFGHWPFGNV